MHTCTGNVDQDVHGVSQDTWCMWLGREGGSTRNSPRNIHTEVCLRTTNLILLASLLSYCESQGCTQHKGIYSTVFPHDAITPKMIYLCEASRVVAPKPARENIHLHMNVSSDNEFISICIIAVVLSGETELPRNTTTVHPWQSMSPKAGRKAARKWHQKIPNHAQTCLLYRHSDSGANNPWI